MLMTPKEAEKTRCCAYIMNDARYVICVADKCMAWRWRAIMKMTLDDGLVPDEKRRPIHGYCGLAGKPEGQS